MTDFKVVLPTTTEEWQKDMNFAYDKGRADAIDEIHTKLIIEIAMLNLNATKMTDDDLYTFAVKIKEIIDKLKEKKQ